MPYSGCFPHRMLPHQETWATPTCSCPGTPVHVTYRCGAIWQEASTHSRERVSFPQAWTHCGPTLEPGFSSYLHEPNGGSQPIIPLFALTQRIGPMGPPSLLSPHTLLHMKSTNPSSPQSCPQGARSQGQVLNMRHMQGGMAGLHHAVSSLF